MDPEVRQGLERSWKTLMFFGVLAIVVGCIAILVPAVASVGTAIFIGWILLVAGAFLVAAAFSAHSVGSLLLRLLWAAITVIVGIWLIVEPHNGTLTLTFVLGVYFLFMGITRITVAFLGRGRPNAGWVGLSGVCGLLIGILVLAISIVLALFSLKGPWSTSSLGPAAAMSAVTASVTPTESGR